MRTPVDVRRHVIVVGVALATVAVTADLLSFSPEWWPDRTYGRRADDTHWRLSVATGVTAVGLIGAALLIGPLRVLRRDQRPVTHLAWRRTIGSWGAVVAWVHIGFGATIHSEGLRLWTPFTHLWRSEGLLRVLGAAVWLGLTAGLLLVPILVTSNRTALTRLGPKRWKRIQRLTYVVAGLVAAHVLGVQLNEQRDLRHAALVWAGIAIVLAAQLAAAGRVRSSAGGTS